MTFEQAMSAIVSAATQHLALPANLSWTPSAGGAALLLGGLLLLVRGARWAPGIGALLFLGLGGLGGSHLAAWLGTPLWPSVGVAAVVALILSLLLFRVWQALLLGVCCAIAGLGAYYSMQLTPAVSSWVADGATVTLPDAATSGATNLQAVIDRGQSLWTYLGANVPNFNVNFWAILAATSLAGLAFGLFLPRASRALWASTIGTAVFGFGTTALLSAQSPAALDWLKADNLRAWGIVGAVWLASLIYNLINTRPARAKITIEAETDQKSALA